MSSSMECRRLQQSQHKRVPPIYTCEHRTSLRSVHYHFFLFAGINLAILVNDMMHSKGSGSDRLNVRVS